MKGETVNDESAIAVRESNEIQLGTLQANSPESLVHAATSVATTLARVIKDRRLANSIQGRSYVRCEGWTTMGAMLGITPQEVSCTCDEAGVYVATVELVNMKTGKVVGRASAECGNPDEVDRNNEPIWAGRPAYARRSMAVTRATSKAFRLSFSWIMTLAGYEATPAEEMPVAESGEPVGHEGARTGGPGPRRAEKPKQQEKSGSWSGELAGVTEKTGTTNNKPWTLFIIKAQDGTEFGTFSETIKEIAEEATSVGDDVEIAWTRTAKGSLQIEGIEVIK